MSEPKYLYRYRPFNDFSKDILDNNTLWFTSPKELDDEYDCRIIVNFDTVTLDFLYIFYKQAIRKIHQNEPVFEQLIQDAKVFFIEGKDLYPFIRHEHGENIPLELQNYLQNIINSKSDIEIIELGKQAIKKEFDSLVYKACGVISMALENDNEILWKEYADDNRGFCLEFNKTIIDLGYLQNKWGRCERVQYNKPRFTAQEFLNLMDNPTDFTNKLIFSKDSKWEDQKEWRIPAIGRNQGEMDDDWINSINRNIDYPPEMLTGVIFGCEMKHEDREAIKHLVQSNPKLGHVRFHEAKKKHNEFGLDIVPLSE